MRHADARPPLWVWAAGLLLAGALFLPEPARAQAPTPSDDEVNAVAKDLYCPVCENVPLDVCPTVACEQWRETIRTKLGEGWGEAEIHRYFADQYGMRVLAAPEARGWNWLAYLVPPIAFLAGAVLIVRTLRRTPEVGPDSPPPPSPEEAARVEAELRQRDR